MIAMDTVDTPIGPLVAAASPAGLALLEFADRFTAERNQRHLVRRFPAWDGVPRGRVPAAVTEELAAYFAGELAHFTLPLDAGGTAFQRRVWAALATIPCGTTASYDGVARLIGDPGKHRAVARANGQNPIAIIVPCHRVIGADGALRGYGGGLRRKAWLLAHEEKMAARLGLGGARPAPAARPREPLSASPLPLR
jgi:AraC family transcriptional regulator of adaptative response/methylated-DNA-[protein]-cysteine methyltransferase